jgi:cofilin
LASPDLIQFSQLLTALSEIQTQWFASQFTGTYSDAKSHSAAFTAYKNTTKRTWVTEKQDVATLFGNVQTKLKTYGLREYVPPTGLALSVRTLVLYLLNV